MSGVLRIQHVSVPMPPDREDDARQFYTGALGLTEKKPPTSLAGRGLVWFHAGLDGLEIHLFTDRTGETPVTAQHLCLQVDSLSEYRAALEEKGVETEDTIEIHNRPRFFIRDPFGNQIEITQVLGEYS